MWYGVHVSMRYSGGKIMNESQKSTDNIITGAVGAFLGSLIGVACIVIVGQLGYVASVSGLVMGVCALKGYEKQKGGCGLDIACPDDDLSGQQARLGHFAGCGG